MLGVYKCTLYTLLAIEAEVKLIAMYTKTVILEHTHTIESDNIISHISWTLDNV